MSNIKFLRLRDWINEVTGVLAAESIKVMADISVKRGMNTTKHMFMTFLSHYLQIIIYDSLTEVPNHMTKEEKFQYVKENFATMKYDLQETIADAFNLSVHKWSGQKVDYYCKIGLEDKKPAAFNKEAMN